MSQFAFGARVCDLQQRDSQGDVPGLAESRSENQDTAENFGRGIWGRGMGGDWFCGWPGFNAEARRARRCAERKSLRLSAFSASLRLINLSSAGGFPRGFIIPRPPVADEVGEHHGDVGVFERDVFAGGAGDEGAAGIFHVGLGFVNAVAAVGDEFGGDEEFLVGRRGLRKAHGEFRAIREAAGADGAGPDHDFIEHGAEDAAVNGLAKTNVLGARTEARVRDAAIGRETEAETEGIGFAADEAGVRVGQGLHAWTVAHAGGGGKAQSLKAQGKDQGPDGSCDDVDE